MSTFEIALTLGGRILLVLLAIDLALILLLEITSKRRPNYKLEGKHHGTAIEDEEQIA